MGLFHTSSHSRAQDTESVQLPFLSHRQSHRQLEFCWWTQTQCSHSRGSGTEILEASSGRKQNGKLDEKLTNVCVHVMSQNVLCGGWVHSVSNHGFALFFHSSLSSFYPVLCFYFTIRQLIVMHTREPATRTYWTRNARVVVSALVFKGQLCSRQSTWKLIATANAIRETVGIPHPECQTPDHLLLWPFSSACDNNLLLPT